MNFVSWLFKTFSSYIHLHFYVFSYSGYIFSLFQNDFFCLLLIYMSTISLTSAALFFSFLCYQVVVHNLVLAAIYIYNSIFNLAQRQPFGFCLLVIKTRFTSIDKKE